MDDSKKHNIAEAALGKAVNYGAQGVVSAGIGALAGSKVNDFLRHSEKAEELRGKLHDTQIIKSVKDTVQEHVLDKEWGKKAQEVWNKVNESFDGKLPKFVRETDDGPLIVKIAAVAGVTLAVTGLVIGAKQANRANQEIDRADQREQDLQNIIKSAVGEGRVESAPSQEASLT